MELEQNIAAIEKENGFVAVRGKEALDAMLQQNFPVELSVDRRSDEERFQLMHIMLYALCVNPMRYALLCLYRIRKVGCLKMIQTRTTEIFCTTVVTKQTS